MPLCWQVEAMHFRGGKGDLERERERERGGGGVH